MKKKGARILVVNDELEIVRLLSRTLRAHDFQVFTQPLPARFHCTVAPQD